MCTDVNVNSHDCKPGLLTRTTDNSGDMTMRPELHTVGKLPNN